jgi:glutamate carboxypeptidase
MNAASLVPYLETRREAMLARLAELVDHESPSQEPAALDSLARGLARRLESQGAEVRRVGNPAGCDHVRARWSAPGPDDAKPPALVLGHFDTVWPRGTLALRPFRVADGRAFGPGIFDMKAGLMLLEFALEAIGAVGAPLNRPVVVLWTSDEEIGSPGSRAAIEAEAQDAAFVLVLEPPLAGGRLKTSRKGVGQFRLIVDGRPAHAGVEPEKGISAVLELAHQVVRLHALNEPAAGTSVNVGVVRGGTTSNVVAASASAAIDVRASTLAEARRIERAIRDLSPVLPGARLAIEGGFNRPPMERSAAVVALFERVRAIGRGLGLELGEGSTGGGSDGNFTAALGKPTLDGLGAPGAGAHAEDEHIRVADLPIRAALLAAALLELDVEDHGASPTDGDPG